MRSRIVFIVQTLAPPVNDNLVELLMMLDIARSASAKEVHAIIPYFSFARSDKKDAPRISITARLIADLLRTAGATHVMTMVLHSPQAHGFFSVPTDPLTSRPVFRHYFQSHDLAGTVVVAPDLGSAKAGCAVCQGPGPAGCSREQGTHLGYQSDHQRLGGPPGAGFPKSHYL